MAISVFDLFSIGIGPSSSHTVGPMKATKMFIDGLDSIGKLKDTTKVEVELFGSLGATGKGHGSDKAVLLGLEGEKPEEFNPDNSESRVANIIENGKLSLLGKHQIAFDITKDLIMHKRKSLSYHSNAMLCSAFDATGTKIYSKTYYSVGGGFVVDESTSGAGAIKEDETKLPFRFNSGDELLKLCAEGDMRICELMLENEKSWRSVAEIERGLLHIWKVMQQCVVKGVSKDGILPGGLKVKRRAKSIYDDLSRKSELDMISPGMSDMDWVNVYAIAVNEENAAGGRVVTAPTNGAAGIMPAVMHFYKKHCADKSFSQRDLSQCSG